MLFTTRHCSVYMWCKHIYTTEHATPTWVQCATFFRDGARTFVFLSCYCSKRILGTQGSVCVTEVFSHNGKDFFRCLFFVGRCVIAHLSVFIFIWKGVRCHVCPNVNFAKAALSTIARIMCTRKRESPKTNIWQPNVISTGPLSFSFVPSSLFVYTNQFVAALLSFWSALLGKRNVAAESRGHHPLLTGAIELVQTTPSHFCDTDMIPYSLVFRKGFIRSTK